MNTRTFRFISTKYFHVHGASLFLMLLLCSDLAFISLHSIDLLSPLINYPLLSLDRDRGYPEMFQYLKWFWIVIMFIYLSMMQKSLHFSAWGIFFTYLLFDDALSIHEKVGRLIASNLTISPPFGLRIQDIGELEVTGIAAVILLSFVFVAYVHGSKTFKKISHDLLLLIFILAFFGVFVDMLHISIKLGWKIDEVFAVIEDGGEMIIASFMCWYVFLLSVRDKDATTYLLDFINRVLTKRYT